jgi:hypothetical protein
VATTKTNVTSSLSAAADDNNDDGDDDDDDESPQRLTRRRRPSPRPPFTVVAMAQANTGVRRFEILVDRDGDWMLELPNERQFANGDNDDGDFDEYDDDDDDSA